MTSCQEVWFPGGSRMQAWSPDRKPRLWRGPGLSVQQGPQEQSRLCRPFLPLRWLPPGAWLTVSHIIASGRELASSRKAWSLALKLSQENGLWRGSRPGARLPEPWVTADEAAPEFPTLVAGHAGHQLLRGDFRAGARLPARVSRPGPSGIGGRFRAEGAQRIPGPLGHRQRWF